MKSKKDSKAKNRLYSVSEIVDICTGSRDDSPLLIKEVCSDRPMMICDFDMVTFTIDPNPDAETFDTIKISLQAWILVTNNSKLYYVY